MSAHVKSILIGIYAVVGLLFAIFEHFWGASNYKSFAYNLGQGVVWPAVMFPSVGKAIGAIVIIGLCGYVALSSRGD